MFSDLAREPRVHRQLAALRGRHRLIGIGTAPPAFDDVEFIPVKLGARKTPAARVRTAAQLLGGRFEQYYWDLPHVRALAEQLQRIRADVIIAHDVDTLPAVVRHAKGARILYDAHDYAPRQFEDRLYFRLFFQRYVTYLTNTYAPRTDRMITVCGGLADEFHREAGVRAEVITNARDYVELAPRLRSAADPIRLVHHGAAIRSRRIERMIEAMGHLDARFQLDLLLVENSPGYVDELRRLAARYPNVAIRPAVPMLELAQALNERYDVGVFHLEPVNFNYRNALPNKLFDYLQARLAVVVSPSVEMARLVEETGCGVVARDFTVRAFADAIAGLTHDRINAFKQRAHAAARPKSSEPNIERIRQLVGELL